MTVVAKPFPANKCYRTLSAGPRIYGATRELVLSLPMHVRRDEMGWDQKRCTQLIRCQPELWTAAAAFGTNINPRPLQDQLLPNRARADEQDAVAYAYNANALRHTSAKSHKSILAARCKGW